ncbi:sugar porter family MFS transporter [Xylophilus sp. GOD-11R]|uniref:sugar porter family MFS transporter n=1 Tax=Xylophilus sp. GOD-11R TaxID=3089814 RepID=UPI00298CD218|nr:sugar porter family MFS transporter [Xylophilus sp. GOD-11R]WPB58844.1 sugar porter family MFS transporter [Xylophilus sp. GOD-11R]
MPKYSPPTTSSSSAVTEAPSPGMSPSAYMSLVATIAAIAGGLYGYDTGIIAGALLQISSEFQLGHAMQEVVAASILAGAVLGALTCTRLSARIGRRYTIMTVAAIFTFGVLACATAPSMAWLTIWRFVLGFAVGGSTQIVPTYIAELAPPDKRGRLVTYFNVSIGVGILLAAIIGFALQESWSWRWMIGVAAMPALALLLGMVWMPRSPRWLMEQGRPAQAREALQMVRETPAEVRAEMAEMRESQRQQQHMARGWSGMRERWVRPALVAGLGVAAFTQLSGIEMMIYYTPTFLTSAGFGRSSALLAALGVAIVYLVMTFIGKTVVDLVGRRALTLAMMPLAALSLVGLGAVFFFHLGGDHHGAWVVGLLLSFMVFNSVGIQVIGWLMGSELYPLAIRDQATGAHAAMLWGSNLLLTGTALSMVNWLGIGAAMWVYAALNALGFVFVFVYVPETRSRSLEDIEQALRDGTFSPLASQRAG